MNDIKGSIDHDLFDVPRSVFVFNTHPAVVASPHSWWNIPLVTNKWFRPTLSTDLRPCVCGLMSWKRSTEDYPSGTLLKINEGASLTFNGDVTIEEIDNVDILVGNYGTME